MEKEIRLYETTNKEIPFQKWINEQKDIRGKIAVLERVNRLEKGLYGLWRRIDEIFELKIDVGPGYRVYFGKHDKKVIILLIAGSKRSQSKDIKKAKLYWFDYKERFK